MRCCCCQSNRVDGTCDRSPCGSKTPVFNSASARYLDGESWTVHILALLLENGGRLGSETAKIQAPAGVTPHSYHEMFPLYSPLLSTWCEFRCSHQKNAVPKQSDCPHGSNRYKKSRTLRYHSAPS